MKQETSLIKKCLGAETIEQCGDSLAVFNKGVEFSCLPREKKLESFLPVFPTRKREHARFVFIYADITELYAALCYIAKHQRKACAEPWEQDLQETTFWRMPFFPDAFVEKLSYIEECCHWTIGYNEEICTYVVRGAKTLEDIKLFAEVAVSFIDLVNLDMTKTYQTWKVGHYIYMYHSILATQDPEI